MNGQVKGCLNKNCSEYHKRYYKTSDTYCVKCGEKLSLVCKQAKCFKQLPDACEDKYCAAHLAERSDKREKGAKQLAAIGTGVLSVAVTVVTLAKKIIKK